MFDFVILDSPPLLPCMIRACWRIVRRRAVCREGGVTDFEVAEKAVAEFEDKICWSSTERSRTEASYGHYNNRYTGG